MMNFMSQFAPGHGSRIVVDRRTGGAEGPVFEELGESPPFESRMRPGPFLVATDPRVTTEAARNSQRPIADAAQGVLPPRNIYTTT